MPDHELAFDINKIDQDFLDDPYPVYRKLREQAPVYRNPDGTFILTRFADVVKAFKHPGMSSDKTVDFKPKFGDGPLYTHHTTSLVFNDPPVHTRIRKLLASAFSPRKLTELEPLVEQVINNLLDRLERQGEFDIIEDYALALPTEVISYMLGVPEEHRHLLHNYSNLILGALDPVVPPEKLQAGHDAVEEFGAMLEELIQVRWKMPGQAGQGEVLAALIFGEIDGEKLTPVELVQNCIFLLNAGHETTANLVGNGISILLDYPDQLKRLQNDPGLIKTAVEEFLRFESPLQIGNRKATADVEFGPEDATVTIPKDAFIHTCIGAANRDPEEFDNPESVDVGRAHNPQIAFGIGKHICMGNTLGRIEGRIAIGKFVDRFPKLRKNGEKKFHGRARFRGLDKLPVAVT
ncbi:MAG: cytochrome [Rhodospirillaceae bacterium]|nr:cytochrome [Rhodospirillaceae bacterium]